MRLLLTSFQHPQIPEFIAGQRVAYLGDAARSYHDAPFVKAERQGLVDMGLELRDISLGRMTLEEIEQVLDSVDALYVAGGETFDLLQLLRDSGADKIISRRVTKGLPYIGCSAGSIVVGPSIEPLSLLDSPDLAPGLKEYTGLNLVDVVIVPHADGAVSQFPIDVIAETVKRYGEKWPLCLLRDGQALWIENSTVRLLV